MSVRFIGVVGLVAAAASTACSSSSSHPPGVSGDCSSNCDQGAYGAKGGGISGTGGGAGLDGAVVADAAAIVGNCATDPTFGVRFCATSTTCSSVVIDTTQLPPSEFCGFVDQGNGTAAVECLCNSQFLCPLGVGADCAALPGLINQQMTNPICIQSSTSSCIDLTQVSAQRDSSTCTPTCIQLCGAMPTCFHDCGC